MSREIRRVPPDWEHPTLTVPAIVGRYGPNYRPLCDRAFSDAWAEWERQEAAWDADEPFDGTRPSEIRREYPEVQTLADWDGGPPRRSEYRDRHWEPDEATAYQVYETVSEGTPVSPVLPTREDLIAWLMTPHPEDMHFARGMTRVGAEAFVEAGSVPSMVVSSHGLETGIQNLDRASSS